MATIQLKPSMISVCTSSEMDNPCPMRRCRLAPESKVPIHLPHLTRGRNVVICEEPACTPCAKPISPTLSPEECRCESPMQCMKESLLNNIQKLDKEVLWYESQICKLQIEMQELEDEASKSSTNKLETVEGVCLKESNQLSLAQIIYSENKRKAQESCEILEKLRPQIEIDLKNAVASETPIQTESKEVSGLLMMTTSSKKKSAKPKSASPKVKRATKPAARKKPATLKKETKPATTQKETKSTSLKKETKPASLKKNTKPATLKKETKPATLRKETEQATIEKDTKQTTTKKETKPATLEKETKPTTTKKETKPATTKKGPKLATTKKAGNTATSKTGKTASPKKAARPATAMKTVKLRATRKSISTKKPKPKLMRNTRKAKK